MPNNYHKPDILRLRKAGKTYSQIQKALGCSKSTISYHCGDGSEKKRVLKSVKNRKPICKKVSSFKSRCSRSNYKSFRAKLKNFKKRSTSNSDKNRTNTIVNNIVKNYTCKDVVEKIGDNPICYLTGKLINLDHPETYNLDHIIPASRGGTNDLENLGICLKEANQAKGDLLLEELYDLCDAILSWRNKCQN